MRKLHFGMVLAFGFCMWVRLEPAHAYAGKVLSLVSVRFARIQSSHLWQDRAHPPRFAWTWQEAEHQVAPSLPRRLVALLLRRNTLCRSTPASLCSQSAQNHRQSQQKQLQQECWSYMAKKRHRSRTTDVLLTKMENHGQTAPDSKGWRSKEDSQNPSMAGVGSDLCGSPSPTPCPSRVTQSRLHRSQQREQKEAQGDTALKGSF